MKHNKSFSTMMLRSSSLAPISELSLSSGTTPSTISSFGRGPSICGSKMRFQVLSDLHLEPNKVWPLEKAYGANALILAGDIGAPESDAYKSLIRDAASMFSYVFVVAGNHEHYGHVWQRTMEIINNTCKQYENVYHLNCSGVDVPLSNGQILRVVGATLWSAVSWEQAEDVTRCLNDFRCMKGWTLEKYIARHRHDVRYIEHEVEWCASTGRKVLVVTHHAPLPDSVTCARKYWNSSISTAFYSQLSHLFLQNHIVAWVFGHTHHNINVTFSVENPVKIVSNQRGYFGKEDGDSGSTGNQFDSQFTFDL